MKYKYDIVTIADLCVDLAISGDNIDPEFGQVEKLVDDYFIELGGSCSIFACQTAKLGLTTAVIGTLGGDIFGELVMRRLKECGVNTDHILIDESLKTSIGVALTKKNDRAILTYNSTCSGVDPSLISYDVIKSSRHLHIGSYYLLDKTRPAIRDLIMYSKSNGSTISIDTNWDPSGKWDAGILDILPLADIFFPNETELKLIMGEDDLMNAIRKASDMVGIVVVKLGRGGAIATDGEKCYRCGIIDVPVADTIGAGDSFDGGFLYAYLSGMSISDSLKIASICGSYNTIKCGGIQGQVMLNNLYNIADSNAMKIDEYQLYKHHEPKLAVIENEVFEMEVSRNEISVV